eukprot:Gb_41340 [translate_table: standard]
MLGDMRGFAAAATLMRIETALSLAALLFTLLNASTHPQDTAALIDFLTSIEDPFGKLSNWKADDPCGDRWEGVFCAVPDSNGFARVSELHLLDHNLTGYLNPSLGKLTNLTILDLMWNDIGGTIPEELSSLEQLQLLLLNGNNLQGSIPEGIGNLSYLNRLQIDQNRISGSIPKSFQNLASIKHLHMNNNSISGSIPEELSKLNTLIHLLVDNNNLSGPLPQRLAPNLHILQLDNNQFLDSEIPPSYAQAQSLMKISLRNCNLKGQIRDFSDLTDLRYFALAFNKLNGSIPTSFSELQNLDALKNRIDGPIPDELINRVEVPKTTIWLDLQQNLLSPDAGNISNLLYNDPNGTIWLYGNAGYCENESLKGTQACILHDSSHILDSRSGAQKGVCDPNSCIPNVEELIIPLALSGTCICAVPISVGIRLKSPSFTFFSRYINLFEDYIARGMNLTDDQVYVDSYYWEAGRLSTVVKLFPDPSITSRRFSQSEAERIFRTLASWSIPENVTLGPLELLYFTYIGVTRTRGRKRGLTGIMIAIGIPCIAATTAIVTAAIYWSFRCRGRANMTVSSQKSRHELLVKHQSFKVAGVKSFTDKELSDATNSFSDSVKVGEGGYGKVYRGVLSDGQVVAIKRAHEDSIQGTNEFGTEMEMLSRVHHRNLVSLIGYSTDNGEQMLVYEYMENGTLRDNLSIGELKRPLDFAARVSIALGAARGILYLHTEANPPIFHRDIKASNILLDKDKNAKVADFGISKFAPPLVIEGSDPGHVSTLVKGTPGYLDPEYFMTRKLTDKSDVYSFGVVLLELVTGMQPIANGKHILMEVNHACKSGTDLLGAVDPNMGTYPSEALEPFMRLALACCKQKPEDRPSMAEVVRGLECIWQNTPVSVYDDPDHDSKDYEDYNNPPLNKSKSRRGSLRLSRNSSIENASLSFQNPIDIVAGR